MRDLFPWLQQDPALVALSGEEHGQPVPPVTRTALPLGLSGCVVRFLKRWRVVKFERVMFVKVSTYLFCSFSRQDASKDKAGQRN